MNIYKIYKSFRLFFFPFIPLYLLVYYTKRLIVKLEKFNIPVICVGNITTGGAGKTPAVIEIAKLLKNMGFSPAVASRGYGGAKSKDGAIVSDGKNVCLTSKESGDEPFMAALSLDDVPIAVCGNRREAIRNLVNQFNINIIITDDGFQNNSFFKDITIIIIDATNPFGNGLILPAGDLREPKFALKKSNIVFINKSKLIPEKNLLVLIDRIKKLSRNSNILKTDYKVEYLYRINNNKIKISATKISGKKVLLITAIGNPGAFQQTIEQLNILRARLWAFPDHYWFTNSDISKFKTESNNYDFVIVTEKDYVKMNGFKLNDKFLVVKISFEIHEKDLFIQLFKAHLPVA